MKGFQMKTKAILVLLLMTSVGHAAMGQITESTKNRSTWNWIQSDDGKKIEVRVENKVEFNDDYSDVANIPDDGALKIIDSRGSHTYRLNVTRGSAGELKREYFVDGGAHEFDSEGRQWLRAVMLQATREGGLDAKERVKRILRQRGARGLAEEITYLKGDYVRRIYFEEFLQVPNLSND